MDGFKVQRLYSDVGPTHYRLLTKPKQQVQPNVLENNERWYRKSECQVSKGRLRIWVRLYDVRLERWTRVTDLRYQNLRLQDTQEIV